MDLFLFFCSAVTLWYLSVVGRRITPDYLRKVNSYCTHLTDSRFSMCDRDDIYIKKYLLGYLKMYPKYFLLLLLLTSSCYFRYVKYLERHRCTVRDVAAIYMHKTTVRPTHPPQDHDVRVIAHDNHLIHPLLIARHAPTRPSRSDDVSANTPPTIRHLLPPYRLSHDRQHGNSHDTDTIAISHRARRQEPP